MSLFATALEFFAGLSGDSIVLVLIVKWTAVLALAWLAHGMLVGRNPRWRVALWRSAIVGLAMVAVLSAAPPIVTYQSVPQDSPSVRAALEAPANAQGLRAPRGCGDHPRAEAEGADPSRAGRCFLDCDDSPRRARAGLGRCQGLTMGIWDGLVVMVDLAGRRPRPHIPADRGEPVPGPARPAIVKCF